MNKSIYDSVDICDTSHILNHHIMKGVFSAKKTWNQLHSCPFTTRSASLLRKVAIMRISCKFQEHFYLRRMNMHIVLFWSVYLIFSLFLQNWLPESIHIFGEMLLDDNVTYWFPVFIVTSFLKWKFSAFIELVLHTLVIRMYGRKNLVNIKYHNLDYFKEAVFLLCKSIFVTRTNVKLK